MKFFLADVNHRRCSLLRAGILGVLSAFFIYYFFFGLKHDILRSSITILFLGLPTFYVLWRFRTHDVQEQIAKTEENTNNSTFFECARMLAEEKPPEHDSLSKKTALEQLAYLKRETCFDKNRIDSLTRGLHLSGEIFEFARFNGLDLSMANLNKAKLAHADLTGANLTGAKLSNVDLTGANLTGAILNGATLLNVTLNRVDLTEVDLTEVDLTGTDLTGVNLNGVDLTKVNLSRVDLTGVDLTGVNLTGVNLSGAELSGTDLTEVNLTGTELNGANLREANLSGANLTDADLTGADLNYANLFGAIYDDETGFIGTGFKSKEIRDEEGMEYRANK